MITGNVLKAHGWPQGKALGLAKAAAHALERGGQSRTEVLAALDRVREDPGTYLTDSLLGALAAECAHLQQRNAPRRADTLRPEPIGYRVWGREAIDDAALAQMDAAMRLPVTAAGALMPDAHVGYGLPIGGVLATEGVVIPFAVGVDIACRMRLSVYRASPDLLRQKRELLEHALLAQTQFGAGAAWRGNQRAEHAVLDEPAWNDTRLLKSLQGKAHDQLGTSGTGNHFVEWGVFSLEQPDPQIGIEPGEYLALLSHSGSRGVGFKIANPSPQHYPACTVTLACNAASAHGYQ